MHQCHIETKAKPRNPARKGVPDLAPNKDPSSFIVQQFSLSRGVTTENRIEKPELKNCWTVPSLPAIIEDGYAYDLYYVDMNDMLLENSVELEVFQKDVFCPRDRNCSSDTDNDSEDSNAESNWRNEYPDTEDSCSVDEDDMRAAVRRENNNCAELSSDDENFLEMSGLKLEASDVDQYGISRAYSKALQKHDHSYAWTGEMSDNDEYHDDYDSDDNNCESFLSQENKTFKMKSKQTLGAKAVLKRPAYEVLFFMFAAEKHRSVKGYIHCCRHQVHHLTEALNWCACSAFGTSNNDPRATRCHYSYVRRDMDLDPALAIDFTSQDLSHFYPVHNSNQGVPARI
ncbi:hypothetical protein PR048_021257 [Dryococelus australis]|uniref:Probable RNA polymerase II nuclear localization protein SLC7A6OS n=1 Tax=Dryococelus australis TaxID=614101 RepID=A0ABQ9GXP3_9NEOP|nr:hypothetical protein PR048_021257 [Dryococelus australis]